jgi:cell division protein FtsQ
MRQSKYPLRGSVTQNNVSARVRVSERDGIGFLARLGILAGILLIFLIAAAIGWHSGWAGREASQIDKYVLNLTQKAQLEVKDIAVEGRRQSSKDDVFDALGIAQGAPILSVDLQGAAARLGKLPWVDSVRVERQLPDTIAVFLTERVSMARWQHDGKFYVIDTQGRVLPSAKPDDFSSLPLVVGLGAERGAQVFLSLLKAYPDIQEKMESAVRVGERRWDLILQPRPREAQKEHANSGASPKVTVRLPEENVADALHRLSVLIAEEKILDRTIVAVDLRVPDRLVLEPAVSAPQTGEKRP